MSEFIFPDLRKTLTPIIIRQNVPTKDLNLNSLDVGAEKIVKSQLTVYLENTLNYMQENNLIPELPQVMNVKYINVSTKEILLTKFKSLFGKKSPEYNYPASTNILDGTIYISNYFQRDFNKDSSIQKFREQFNQNITQTIEYAFFHEIGHLFLIEKNKDKTNKHDDTLFKSLITNIEEGFAESFAIHMMCLKYPQLELETNKFKYFQQRTDKLSSNVGQLFNYKKHDELKKTVLQEIKDFVKPPEIKIEEMFNPYEFPLIYKNTPFKDLNGKLITDMNIIFEKCLGMSLKNNIEVIKFKTTNSHTQEFKQELIENFQLFLKNPSGHIDELITSFHNKVKNDGFISKKITGIRNLYLNVKTTTKNNIL